MLIRAMGDYIANAIRLNISFNYVFVGSGEPFMAGVAA